ncbi:hypothetical protein PVAP13_9NG146819 [Panicum virgatum]|uniref:Uncharacterized protein n=1 Tax=Panicum virgatum TaxID=38727 RepID=A0A8T0MI41_PANVG|nr:hypothetical protein PVAP13_9NG146819 [Panicum virgatum]
MLSGGDDGVPDGIGMARLAWTRLPTADAEGAGAGPSTSAAAACDELFSAAAVESLDYEVIENYAYREEQAQRSKFWVPYYVMLKWLFSLLIGVGTGLAAIFINLAVENFWMEIYCNVCYNKAFVFCGILCLHHFQFSPCLIFCIHSHKLCSSSCWIWYSRDQRLFKWSGYTWNPPFQNISWEDLREHWISWRWIGSRKRRASCSYWGLHCFSSWTRWICKIPLEF